MLLKVPAGEASPEGAAERLRREAEIIRLLHPDGCLRLEEIHTGPHGPELVAAIGELVPLRRHAGARGLPTATFLPLAVRLAGIIARLHRQGLIHGDLNPGILLLDASKNTPYLIDCSRAVKAGNEGRDQVPHLPPARRPFAYLSPEQTGRLNRPVDRRTDIYSLGVILYELATGRLPVAAGDPLEWFHALVAGEIKAPCELEAGLPPVISDIIMKCLVRDPEHRYQSAAGVENDLLECLARWQQKGRVDRFVIGRRDGPLFFEFSPAFIGKERELGVLRAALERAAQGPGVAVLIAGEAGSGKTRLAREFMQQVGHKQGVVIAGKFAALKSALPYQPITGALDQVLDRIMAGSQEEIACWQRLITANLGPYVSALTAIMPRMKELVGEQPQLAAPTILQEQQRFLSAFVRLMQLFARQGAPLVFFLDDLQWADPE
ncbi:MAG: AAA family ATPase, partial [Moorella sp. (in: Bacteria)]|nr:AAA family ATPase [Moorella sp. (in: firmicutes)]